MRKILAEADRRAVDAVFNRRNNGAADGGGFVSLAHVQAERVQSVEKILSLLQEMPAAEPSADLASRTLDRIDAAIAHQEPALPLTADLSAAELSDTHVPV